MKNTGPPGPVFFLSCPGVHFIRPAHILTLDTSGCICHDFFEIPFRFRPISFNRIPSLFNLVPLLFNLAPLLFNRIPSLSNLVPSSFNRIPSSFNRICNPVVCSDSGRLQIYRYEKSTGTKRPVAIPSGLLFRPLTPDFFRYRDNSLKFIPFISSNLH